jgi:[acyl-carrier-protein] S-malonyltransferase
MSANAPQTAGSIPEAALSGRPAAFLFSGQGAQVVGMADGLLAASPRARALFDRGREVLGIDIERICREGPPEELNSTRVSQPAIFLHSMAILSASSESGPNKMASPEGTFGAYRNFAASAAAGLSLGEYSALVFAGSLEFEEALEIVGARGRFMQEACDLEPGGMVSIIGLSADKVEEAVARGRSAGPIGIANYNAPNQLVISGARAALEAASAAAKEMGCRRAIALRVAGAYHSPLMAPATARLRPLLERARILAPRLPFYSNVSGAEVQRPEEIRDFLIRQVESPVRWENILRGMAARGIDRALEVGPGQVLAGLARSIDCGITVTSAEDELSSRKAAT